MAAKWAPLPVRGSSSALKMGRASGWNLWLCDTDSRYTTNVWALVTVSPRLSLSLADAQWLSPTNSLSECHKARLSGPPKKCPAILEEPNVLAKASFLTGETIRPREPSWCHCFDLVETPCGPCVATLLPYVVLLYPCHLGGREGGSLQPHLEILEFSQQCLSMDSWYSCEGDCNLEWLMLPSW